MHPPLVHGIPAQAGHVCRVGRIVSDRADDQVCHSSHLRLKNMLMRGRQSYVLPKECSIFGSDLSTRTKNHSRKNCRNYKHLDDREMPLNTKLLNEQF